MRACDDFGERFRPGFGNSLHESWMIRTEICENIADAGLHHVNDTQDSSGPMYRASMLSHLLQSFEKGIRGRVGYPKTGSRKTLVYGSRQQASRGDVDALGELQRYILFLNHLYTILRDNNRQKNPSNEL